MPDQPNFPIPDELTPDTFCLCLQIPNDPIWKQVFVGLLMQPAYWFNWQRDEARSGKQLAAYWTKLFDDIDWSTMSCCCDQPPAIFRYNSDGVYQRSTDGGATWVDAPEYDYRNTSTIFPPPSALGIDNTKCQAADGAVVILNEDVIQGLDNGAAVQAILEFIAAVLIFYLSAGTLATVAIGLFSMAAAIFGFGVASTKAAFTTDVLNQLRCSIFNAMSSDDAIDAPGFAALLSDINSNYTGIIKTSLYAIISAAGPVGMTNMLRSNRGSADANCDNCNDCCTMALWTFFDGNSGVTVTKIDCEWEISSQQRGDGNWYVIIVSSSSSDCCQATNIDPVSGNVTFQSTAWCGEDGNLVVTGIHPNNSIVDQPTTGYLARSGSPFTITIHTD